MIRKSLESPSPAGFSLCKLPPALKITVTAFLVLLTGGLAAAVGHAYFASVGADGRPTLTMTDFRVALGGERPSRPAVTLEDTRLWRQIHGEMREYLKSRTEFEILEAWLRSGAGQATFDWPWAIGPTGPHPAPGSIGAPGKPAVTQPSFQRAPAEIIRDNCVGCHNPGGEVWRSPLNGYASVARYTVLPERPEIRIPEMADRIDVIHAQLLTIPVLALLVAFLFYWADWPPGSPGARAVITVLPIACVLADVAFTGLSRTAGVFIYATLAARGAFLLTIAVQLVGVLGGMWQKPGQVQTTGVDA